MANNEEKRTNEVRYVETFSPEEHLIKIPSKTNPGECDYYLMVQWRKKWMLEYNSNWAMVTEHQIHTDLRMITATTSIFDENGKLRSTGSASIYLEDALGNRVETPLELVETRALGRALGNAGFGTQYALPGASPEEKDVLAEAPIGIPNMRDRSVKAEGTEATKAKGADETGTTEGDILSEPSRRGRNPGTKNAEKTETEEEAIPGQEIVASEGDSESETDLTAPETSAAGTGLIATVEDAKAYVIPIGTEKGKYMGEVFAMNKKALLYYAEKYNGKEVNLRRAARILLKLPLED